MELMARESIMHLCVCFIESVNGFFGLVHLERLPIFRNFDLIWRCLVDIKDEYFSQKGFTMENFQSLLRRVSRPQLALDRLLHSYRFLPLTFLLRTVLVSCRTAQSPSKDLSVDSYAVIAAAALLLLLVYHYLTGCADRGGSKAYSSGCLDFRDTFIAIILFHGAYVWIKFRDVAPKGVYRREKRDKRGNIIRVVFEPRFKPPRTNGEASYYIYAGQYETEQEAKDVYRITAEYFKGQGGRLELVDGNSLTIPPMTESDRLEIKRVGARVRSIYESFKTQRANASLPGELQVVGVEHTNSVCLNWADTTHGAPLLVSPTHNSEIAPCGNHDLDSLCEFCIVGLGFPPGNGVKAQAFNDASDSQEGVATQSAMGCGSENQLDPIQILLRNQHELMSRMQELSEALQQRDFEYQQLKVQVTELRNHQCSQDFSSHSFSLQDEHPFQVIDQGVPTSQACVDPISDDIFGYFAYPSIARS